MTKDEAVRAAETNAVQHNRCFVACRLPGSDWSFGTADWFAGLFTEDGTEYSVHEPKVDVLANVLSGALDSQLDKLNEYIALRRHSIAAFNATRMLAGTRVRVTAGCRQRELRGCEGVVGGPYNLGKVYVRLDRPPMRKWAGEIRFPADLLELL